jgi:uncharacterized Zn finger protein
MSSRIGKGPWARAFGAALVPDESTAEAQRGKQLAREGAVHDLRIEVGLITADVEGCKVTLSTPRVPERIWTAMTRYARNRGGLEQAVAGRTQSVQLEHLMTQDWDEPLVPAAMVRTCSCSDAGMCVHVAALAYTTAERIDLDPKALLTWRGCANQMPARKPEEPVAVSDPWAGSRPPALAQPQSRPAGSVPHRLGPSGVLFRGLDVVDVLKEAYRAFRADSAIRRPPS